MVLSTQDVIAQNSNSVLSHRYRYQLLAAITGESVGSNENKGNIFTKFYNRTEINKIFIF